MDTGYRNPVNPESVRSEPTSDRPPFNPSRGGYSNPLGRDGTDSTMDPPFDPDGAFAVIQRAREESSRRSKERQNRPSPSDDPPPSTFDDPMSGFDPPLDSPRRGDSVDVPTRRNPQASPPRNDDPRGEVPRRADSAASSDRPRDKKPSDDEDFEDPIARAVAGGRII